MRAALVGIALALSLGCVRDLIPGRSADRDGDGIDDDVDKCPTVPEDVGRLRGQRRLPRSR